MKPDPAALMAEILEEEDKASDYGDGMDLEPNPYSAWKVARAYLELGAAAVPYLVETSGGSGREAEWAYHALELLGLVARDAAEALAGRIDRHPRAAVTLFLVDPDRAMALELHRSPATRDALAKQVHRHAPAFVARYFTRLLEESDPELVKLGLSSSHEYFANHHPDLIPVDLVRGFARDEDPEIARRARKLLAVLHHAEDADLVLALGGGASSVRWLAPLQTSHVLASSLGIGEVVELLCRRACANASNSMIDVRDALQRSLREPNKRLPWRDREDRADLAREARDVTMLAEVLRLEASEVDTKRLVIAIASYGAAGRDALDAALAERATSLHEVRAALDAWSRPAWTTVEGGDERFANGKLEHWRFHDSAYGSYALALRFEPTNAHAALQLAWIDRGFGTPIEPARLEWLRTLGVRDAELLDELSRPVLPLPGPRDERCPEALAGFRRMGPELVAIAEAAGLGSIAIRHVEDAAEQARLHARTAHHLERIRRATAR